MDDLDRNIIGLLSADARMSVATLARRMKVARSTVQARLERQRRRLRGGVASLDTASQSASSLASSRSHSYVL